MLQSLLRPSRITPWLKRSVLSFSSKSNRSVYGSKGIEILSAFDKSSMLGDFLLTDTKYDQFRAVSPSSFQLLLSFLAAGSSDSTLHWILDFFNAESVDHLNHTASLLSDVILADSAPGGPRMRCSTALWLDHSLTLNPSFKHTLHSHYKAVVNPVDFQIKAAHVGQQNEVSGLVKDIIREGSLNNNSVKLVFTDALYFKGAWAKWEDYFTEHEEP